MNNELKPNTTEYKNAFNKQNYDTFLVYVPKGDKEKLKGLAKSRGKSLNAFVVEAINEKIEREE